MADKTGSAEQDPAPNTAYQLTIRLGIREITRRLNGCLGGTLVAALAGAKDTKASCRWAKEDGPQPRPEAIKRLTFAYEQWWKVAEAEGEHVARLWFIGAPIPGWMTTRANLWAPRSQELAGRVDVGTLPASAAFRNVRVTD